MDTSTPAGRLVFNVIASIAQFEREIMLTRQPTEAPDRSIVPKQFGLEEGSVPFRLDCNLRRPRLRSADKPRLSCVRPSRVSAIGNRVRVEWQLQCGLEDQPSGIYRVRHFRLNI